MYVLQGRFAAGEVAIARNEVNQTMYARLGFLSDLSLRPFCSLNLPVRLTSAYSTGVPRRSSQSLVIIYLLLPEREIKTTAKVPLANKQKHRSSSKTLVNAIGVDSQDKTASQARLKKAPISDVDASPKETLRPQNAPPRRSDSSLMSLLRFHRSIGVGHADLPGVGGL